MNRGYCNTVNLSYLSDKYAALVKVLKPQYLKKSDAAASLGKHRNTGEKKPENRGEGERLVRG